jgi:hypothetical protein
MTTTRSGEFRIANWDEQAYAEPGPDRKLTEARVEQEFTGDVTGSGEVRWLMCYAPDGTADFVGLQRIEGAIDGREGSVVLQTVGRFDGGEASASWTVLAGSGTGGLEGMTGEGGFRAPPGDRASFTLDCTFG